MAHFLAASGGTNPFLSQIIWIVVLFGMMYFLLIRPQQKEQGNVRMIRSLKPGDKILTNGGLVGVITKVEDLSIKVRIAEKVEVEVVKTGVARRLKD